MKIGYIFLLTTTLLFLCTQGATVVDLAGRFSNYTCFRNSGISQVIIRAYHSYGAIDLDAKLNIFQSNAAGLSTDIYMFPCRGKDAATQVKELLDYLKSMKDDTSLFAYTTGTIWLDIETNPSSGCSWSQGTYDTNCQFIKTLVDELQAQGRSVGIFASHYMWLQILGAVDKCNIFTNLPLWYAHYDQKQDWDDWTQNKFGGWVLPTLKQYAGDASICGFKADLSYY